MTDTPNTPNFANIPEPTYLSVMTWEQLQARMAEAERASAAGANILGPYCRAAIGGEMALRRARGDVPPTPE